MRILLVEDDESVANILQKVLTNEHYAVDVATDGRSGWQLVNGTHYDLVILDVVLPELDGLEFCRQLRNKSYNMPVLFVTALNASSKKVAGLNAGADDYITKPFELEELLARVRALLRRVKTSVALTLQWGALRLEVNSREVTYQGQPLSLTPKEYAILELFLRNPAQAFSRQAILDSLWSYSDSPGEETVTSHIKGLRRKLKKAGAPADFVETVYGVGYRLKPVACEESLSEAVQATGLSSDGVFLDDALNDASEGDPTFIQLRRQQTQAALATLWKSVKGQQTARLRTLQQAIEQLQIGNLSSDLRRSAYRSAHSLTGVLGIFGSKQGSHTADQIQVLLKGDTVISATDQRRLKSLVETLNTSLSDDIEHHHNIAVETLRMPLLVLVDPQLEVMPTLVSALWAKGLTVKISQEIAGLSTILSAVDSAADNDADDTASPTDDKDAHHQFLTMESTIPDVILLNFSFKDADAEPLNMLNALAKQLPSLMILICSADGSLSSRVKASQLGDYPFFCQPDAASVIKTIELLRSHPPAKTQKILAVDDDPQLLQALQTRLEHEGYQIVTLNKPVEFWQTLQTEAPDLLLLDISMPDFTGIELCQTVRQAPAWSHLPIVFFTSHTDAHSQQVALRAGADNLIEKSAPDSQMLSHLNSQIKRSHLQKAIQQANAAIAQCSSLPAS
ncbi:MAG: response regulator transcription factor [Cyanobacteria bacterium J06554_11]